jgi:histidinol-phosphate aminotransferase
MLMSEFDFSAILRPELLEVQAYAPHPGNFPIRLDANETPAFLSRSSRMELAEAAASVAWERYPDATASAVRQALARASGVTVDEILVGAGSDELIALLLTAICNPREAGDRATIVTSAPTFVMYRLGARVRGLHVLEVPLDEHWDLPVEEFASVIESARPSVIFIATPNNPTGNLMSVERVAAIAKRARNSLVVVDEAYIEYAPANHLALYREHDNVVLLRTLSKLGFAALRLGWLIGRPEVVRELNKVRTPYNVSTVTQHLGAVVIERLWPEVRATIGKVIAERERLTREVSRLKSFAVQPSHANFLWVRTEQPSAMCFSALAEQGILVRSFHERGGRLAQHLRITVGTPEENDAVLVALQGLSAR